MGDPILDSDQWLAGRFSLYESFRITSVEGYLSSASDGGTFSVALYADGGVVPGGLLFLTGASAPSVAFDTAGNAIPGWFGPSGLDWVLLPGDYWVAFEVRVVDTFSGFMANPAPNPFAFEAIGSGVGGTGVGGYAPESASAGGGVVDIGVRISAIPVPVPAPNSLLLLTMGAVLLLMLYARRVGLTSASTWVCRQREASLASCAPSNSRPASLRQGIRA
jgi:hypothetical protein